MPNTLPIAIAITAIIRVVTFFFSLKGAEPSGGIKFLLSVLGSLLAVVGAGHTDTINDFGSALAQLFAAVQAIYVTAKYVFRFIAPLFTKKQ